MFHKYLIKSGIDKQYAVSSLQHSYASHLYEAGIDIHIIQHLLGFNTIKSTKHLILETHVNKYNIYNPFDDMFTNLK